ncbi:MAG: SDR family NAD(P)-dependent oxidoreductase, partial [Chloroflexi bacterium]
MARLRGAAVLITGASSGIGEATALAFAHRGARLALCARRFDRLQGVGQRCRAAGANEVVLRRADISRPPEARGFVAAALSSFDRIDVLVNNAGVGWRGRFQDMAETDLVEMLQTNVLAAMLTTQAALPSMLQVSSGVVVNVASVLGFRAMPYSAAYSASKHALVGLSHALRGELSGTGVKVSVVYPGTTATEFFHGERPDGPLTHPASWVARAIVRTARHPRRDVVILPYRVGHLVEPVLGGPLDHVLGELRRARDP